MSAPQSLLSVDAALAVVDSSVSIGPNERVPLSEAFHRVLGADVSARTAVPPFDNSAMDGYAVRVQDLAAASEAHPVGLRVAGITAAGAAGEGIEAGECQRIFTGAPLPRGADGVVMQEDVTVDSDGQVWFREPLRPWRHVRFSGEDIEANAPVLGEGHRLRAVDLGFLSAVGVHEVAVRRRPRVAVIATGSELTEPGKPLAPGGIYESNRQLLVAWLAQWGADAQAWPLAPDDRHGLSATLREASGSADVVLVTGGASVGDHDHARGALEDAGGDVAFHRVAMKPGKPVLFGRVGPSLFFGLPGNPVSALVTFLVFVLPAIRKYMGEGFCGLPTAPGTAGEPFSIRGDRTVFLRVRRDAEGVVRSAGPQGSHQLSTVLEANGLLRLDPSVSIAKGAALKVLSLT